MPPQGVPLAPAPPVMEIMDDEPPNKKTRSEDHLVPETVFLQRHSGPVTIQIQVPNMMEKSEWRLNGQTIPVTLVLTDNITVLKTKIQEDTGMPPAKQKISYEVITDLMIYLEMPIIISF